MAFEFLAPLLTPTALKVVQSQPSLFVTLVAVPIALSLLGALIWYINFETSKAYPALKKKDPSKTGLKRLLPF